MSGNIRLLAHGSGAKSVGTLGPGRSGNQISSAAGSYIDVVDNSSDFQVLTANGYIKVAYVGTTAQRPVNPTAGTPYIDTTLAYTVIFDGVVWRNPVNGNSV
jgi:hypothetical protein